MLTLLLFSPISAIGRLLLMAVGAEAPLTPRLIHCEMLALFDAYCEFQTFYAERDRPDHCDERLKSDFVIVH